MIHFYRLIKSYGAVICWLLRKVKIMDDFSFIYDDIERETDAAYLLVFGDQKIWLPKSQIRVYEKNKKVFVPEWLAIEKGLL